MAKKVTTNQLIISISGEYEPTLTLTEICRACDKPVEWVIALVEEGVLDPQGDRPIHWLFTTSNLRRALRAQRMQQDLGLNMPGIAVALDLLDEIDRLERKLHNQR
ncbi:chaperone modulator CbpM [Vibrio sp. STUT-A11]|uniref:chaperone modulator CbpM n=1 Tax=unclassified Vibrio TaxID=2614977 RepID=UPI0022314A57|nr:chaperone modulator CbpM [Vibrio sp. STUT-A11]BDR16464.1 chaperone modulatory protein CbpM [Vibrio sp. STUT-A11]